MVVAPSPFACAQGPDWEGEVYVWDLDRTYLRTEFESVRDLIRTALQRAKDKVAYPGVSAFLRALRRGVDGKPRPIYFVSASPPQLGKVIRQKFAIDRVDVDGIYFKDNLRNVRPSRIRRLREHVGYKLLALLDLKARLPARSRLVCFGDDFESDARIYSLYAEILGRWLTGRALSTFLAKQGVFPDEASRIAWRARRVAKGSAVDRIFIHLHRTEDARYYRRFGAKVIGTRNYFQTAFVCAAEGRIDAEGLAEVGEEILGTRLVNAHDLATGIHDLLGRGVVSEAAVMRLGPALVERRVLPAGFP